MNYRSRYSFLVIIVFLSVIKCTTAQIYTQTIRGKVVDSDSKVGLPGVNIVVLTVDPVTGAATDEDGNYRIPNIPVGRHSIKITMVGYEDLVLNNIILNSGKEVILPVELKEKVYTTGTVEVVFEKDKTKANNEMVSVSARNFQSEETNRYAGSRGDPSKMAANFAGVASGNDARNDIIVRGNSPLGVLWRLEGVDIPNPNHFSAQGATGGPISMLNNNLLGNSDFLTGAFPAEYGNKIAAVFDLKLRNGNNERMEYTGQLGLNGLEFGIEGPISKKAGNSFLANYRYSTLDLFDMLGIHFGVSGIPRYQDFSFKVNLPTSKSGIFTIWGLGGKSNIELKDSEKDSTDWSFTSKGEDILFGSNMGATGLSHLYFFNDKTSGKLNLSVSASEFIVRTDTLSEKNDKFLTFNNTSLEGQYHINYVVSHKLNSRNLFKSGVTYSGLFFNYKSFYYSRFYKKYIDVLREKAQAGLVQAYIHWQHRLTDKLTFNQGLHYQQFLLNNSKALEPRSGLIWQFKPNQSLNFGYGLHSQIQPLIYYYYKTFDPATDSYVQTNQDLSLTRSHHFITGYNYQFHSFARVKSEVYYQSLFAVPIEKYKSSAFSMINVGNDIEGLPMIDSLTHKGTGSNYGIELTIEKFFSRNYYFLFTTTLYESKYTGSDNIERHSSFSGGYIFNALGGIEIPFKSGNRIFALDGKVTQAAGNRYTPVDIAASLEAKQVVYDAEEAFSKRYKDYSKVDIKLSYKTNHKKISQTWFINLENIFNTKNILRQVYDPSTGQTRTEYQLGLFPYGGYRIEF